MVSTANINLDQVTVRNGRQISVTHTRARARAHAPTDMHREITDVLNYDGR
jgi:hypothetical protein